MKKRKKMIVSKIQAKTTYSLMGIIFLGIAGILATVAIVVSNNHRNLSDINYNNVLTINRIDNITAIQDNAIEELMMYSRTATDPKQKVAIEEFAMDYYNNLTTIQRNIRDIHDNVDTINGIIKKNAVMILLIIVIVIIQGVVIYLTSLRVGNGISGPIFVISRFLRDYIDGKKPELRPLRQNDELKEFYALFSEAMEHVKKQMIELQKKDQ